MAAIRLSGQLRAMVGGGDHPVPGDTVLSALVSLERQFPQIGGWILDERRHVRRHINVFVDGLPATGETAVGAASRIHVLPSITGGMQ